MKKPQNLIYLKLNFLQFNRPSKCLGYLEGPKIKIRKNNAKYYQ